MKDVVKTGIVVGIVLIVILFVYGILGNLHYGVEFLTRTTLDESDPTISILLERVEANNSLRRAKLVNTDLTSEEIIEFTLDNLMENDYTEMQAESKKIVCIVNDKIRFNSNEQLCKLIVIDNNVFMDYQKKYFNTEIELEYNEIKYRGYYCKNDGSKYYCQLSSFSNNILDYSVFDSAYEEKDKIILRGYYLRVDVSDNEKCKKYFNDTYCNGYKEMSKPTIGEAVIKSDGVLYEHVFKRSDTSYYLESSYIVSEG